MKNQFKKTLSLLLLVVFLVGSFIVSGYADAYVNVNGYYRKDGTYVRPHVRSDPNGLKYDNYGWKPSDGLYNETYGERGSDWDTPTFITDPDYYEGKRLYENGSSGIYYSDTNNKYCPDPMIGAQRCYLWESSPTKHHAPPAFSKRIYKTPYSSTVWELSHWSSFGWGTRKPFNNASAFLRKGYKWSDIKTINSGELEKYKWTSKSDMYFW